MIELEKIVNFGVGKYQLISSFACFAAAISAYCGFTHIAIVTAVLAGVYNLILVVQRQALDNYLSSNPDVVKKLVEKVLDERGSSETW